MKRKSKDPIIAAQVPVEVRDALCRLAKADNRTVSSYLRIVLERHVARRLRKAA